MTTLEDDIQQKEPLNSTVTSYENQNAPQCYNVVISFVS